MGLQHSQATNPDRSQQSLAQKPYRSYLILHQGAWRREVESVKNGMAEGNDLSGNSAGLPTPPKLLRRALLRPTCNKQTTPVDGEFDKQHLQIVWRTCHGVSRETLMLSTPERRGLVIGPLRYQNVLDAKPPLTLRTASKCLDQAGPIQVWDWLKNWCCNKTGFGDGEGTKEA